MQRNIAIKQRGCRWLVCYEENDEIIKRAYTKGTALKWGEEAARREQCDLIVYTGLGKLDYRNSFATHIG
ncbi:hypothetical protein [Phytohalomonas tamaricis]|uniref:hypothetical protein n=1 Tax=Phytohalomonas tamaricis TaxID=2081032 RepID=UPI000D0ABE04|nr:hypothetical protein [Phytohalomonas tamaricis]